ncbi:Uncharacterized protein HZ326_4915 [Fusarium oxysporum f. sp. albedinis]|nr:Uncharacterized protein HZ326_4915 [Fusarium oxysporum f. sp. albedinis]
MYTHYFADPGDKGAVLKKHWPVRSVNRDINKESDSAQGVHLMRSHITMVKSQQTRQDKKRLTDKGYWLYMALELFSWMSHLRTLPNSSQVLCASVENE